MRLNREFYLDLTWWREFFNSQNGHSFLSSPQWVLVVGLQVSLDAEGSVGYGVILSSEWVVISDITVHCLQGA